MDLNKTTRRKARKSSASLIRKPTNALLAASIAILKAQAHCERLNPYEIIAYIFGFSAGILAHELFRIKTPLNSFLLGNVGGL